ncbi:esterase/lipase family protein [Desmospora profundinema]|uniref:Triacylglycerol esterase/lipase EstA (Alpha/beta hydrolase family) n=1 Tax=Desmospora profundinema TaxID=1571184 RepID=A0ABU1ILQ3_9BACL|nr:alpha/beta fold hydrolase [Desmospora profundinema]MDR6225707.1 triacylglycerol esterase/lipase EstA (alpha/beta hydrolase family) [Desmospora profundinema]
MNKYGGIILIFLLAFTFSIPGSGTAVASPSSALGGFLTEQGPPPPGANDPNCRPDEAHPVPVVLVPGTFETMAQNWAVLSPLLAEKGYCVYSLNYGYSHAGPATGPIEDSAEELKIFIDNVLQLTGAQKVSIVGHSQGGMMPRYYIKFLGGSKKVDNLIGLAPSNHGTTGLVGLSELTSTGSDLTSCAACLQQLAGSEFLKKLNEGNETPGRVSYTVVATRNDQVVVPYTSSFLSGTPNQVANITLQDYYPLNNIEHQGIAYDPDAFTFVMDALAHEGPADPERAVGLIK